MRKPIDARLPAIGLVAATLSPPTGEPLDPLIFATGPLLDDGRVHRDARGTDLVGALVEVAARLAQDHALCCASDPLEVVQALAYEIQSEHAVCARPWMRDTDDDNPTSSTTPTERNPAMPLLPKKKSATPVDPERAALDAVFAGRPTVRVDGPAVIETNGWSPEQQRRAELEAQSDVGDVELADDGITITAIRIPTSPDAVEYANEHQFAWRDDQWMTAAGDRFGLELARADRFQRAAGLARLGRLLPAEVAHLQWLASAPGAWDDVPGGTVPLTAAQAARILESAEGIEQRGRSHARPGSIASAVGDLEGILERRGPWGA